MFPLLRKGEHFIFSTQQEAQSGAQDQCSFCPFYRTKSRTGTVSNRPRHPWGLFPFYIWQIFQEDLSPCFPIFYFYSLSLNWGVHICSNHSLWNANTTSVQHSCLCTVCISVHDDFFQLYWYIIDIELRGSVRWMTHCLTYLFIVNDHHRSWPRLQRVTQLRLTFPTTCKCVTQHC